VKLLNRMAEDVAEYGFVESHPRQDGRNMVMVFGPHKKKAQAMAEARQRKTDAEKAAARQQEQPSTPQAEADPGSES
jgi:translation initiation factor IF-3